MGSNGVRCVGHCKGVSCVAEQESEHWWNGGATISRSSWKEQELKGGQSSKGKLVVSRKLRKY